MTVAIVTGSAGLVGSAAVRRLAEAGHSVVGIDNDMRARFFGEEASTQWMQRHLADTVPDYVHHAVDVRDRDGLEEVFAAHGDSVRCIVHAAAQPSHDWAATDPETDFDVNARATLLLLELTRRHCPAASFVFMSTNKVYGDKPNDLPLVEEETRWELEESHPFHAHGIDESMSVDHCKHSLFGVSKLAADAMVQEYGRYFGMSTVCFRAGCITGPAHAGTRLHGFLSYLVRCALTETQYTIVGYGGKQVRDNIHADDLASMVLHHLRAPRQAEVYNTGGGRPVHCSLLEAIGLAEEATGKRMKTRYVEENRIGDHVWYVSDTRRFESHHPEWRREYDLRRIVMEIRDGLEARLSAG